MKYFVVLFFQRKGGEEPAKPLADADGRRHRLHVLQRPGHGRQHHGDL